MKSFGDLVKQAQKMQKRMVTAVVDGRQRLIEVKIGPDALTQGDATLLEDLVMTAIGEAQRASAAHMKETLGKLTGGVDLPF